METDEAVSRPLINPLLSRLPTFLLVVGCLLSLFELSMQSARGIGLTQIVFHLVGGALLLLVLGIPFAYQMHTTGNGRGLIAGTLLWILVGMANFATVLTNWPLKISLRVFGDELIQMQKGLKPNETRSLHRPTTFFMIYEIRKLENGNTWFISGVSETGSRGLVYIPGYQPVGINIWSDIEVTKNWHMVEED